MSDEDPEWEFDEKLPQWARRKPYPEGDEWELEVEVGEGPAVLGQLLGPDGQVIFQHLEYRPVRFGFRKPGDCYEDETDEPS